MNQLTYLAALEQTDTGYSVFFPDVPGCISVGKDIDEACSNAKEALELHIYGMQKDGNEIPKASSQLASKDTEGCLIAPITIFPALVEIEMHNN